MGRKDGKEGGLESYNRHANVVAGHMVHQAGQVTAEIC